MLAKVQTTAVVALSAVPVVVGVDDLPIALGRSRWRRHWGWTDSIPLVSFIRVDCGKLRWEVSTIGMTYVGIGVTHPSGRRRALKERFLVDSGAVYSVVSGRDLAKLGIKPHSKQEFTLANGQAITRGLGDALFIYQGRRGASPVVFGEPGDSCLLGSVTLEALGLSLDPLRRELNPLPMLLA